MIGKVKKLIMRFYEVKHFYLLFVIIFFLGRVKVHLVLGHQVSDHQKCYSSILTKLQVLDSRRNFCEFILIFLVKYQLLNIVLFSSFSHPDYE